MNKVLFIILSFTASQIVAEISSETLDRLEDAKQRYKYAEDFTLTTNWWATKAARAAHLDVGNPSVESEVKCATEAKESASNIYHKMVKEYIKELQAYFSEEQ